MSSIYILAGESYMIRESLKILRNRLRIQYPEFNVTEFKSMPKAQELIEACRTLPFMSDKRLVVVAECTALTSKGMKKEAKEKTKTPAKALDSGDDEEGITAAGLAADMQEPEPPEKDEGKAIANFLSDMPETTVLVLCTGDAIDKRRALYTKVKALGTVKEFAKPGADKCVEFVKSKAKQFGAIIDVPAAVNLVDAAGCDYYVLEGEIAKLAAYSGYGEITQEHVAKCAAKSLEYNVFELHGYLMNKQAAKARELLGEILRSERPEGLTGLIARKFRDMYKVKSMAESNFSIARVAEEMGYKSYAVQMILKDANRFSAEELRGAISELANLDYGIKSGEKDASLALPETLFKIYKL